MSDRWRRIRGRGGRGYYPAAVGLLLLAALLRFYDLSGNPLGNNEYVVVAVGIGSFSQFMGNLHLDSVPVIHPLLLWVLQDVTDSPWVIRAIPATASVLAMAALLFLLPRLGIARWVALLAAALLAVSLPAVVHARDAQEYSLDTLVAALMTAGLLLYLRTGRKGLLCVTLFLGPLVLYGLALYGAAVLATAAIAYRCRAGSSGGGPGAGGSGQGGIRGWLKERRDWFWPAAALLAGSAATWLISLRYQWSPGGWGADDEQYLKPFYFDWENNSLSAALLFAVSRVWDLLSWQMPAAVAALAVVALGIMLLRSIRRRQVHPILILALFSLGIAVAAALLSRYPLGGIRQASYWGPIIFLAVGLAFYGGASQLAAGRRREWIRPALLGGLTLVILGVGANAISKSWIYSDYSGNGDDRAAFYAALGARLHPEDAVYNGYGIDNRAAFYWRENPKHYRLWRCRRESAAGCREETVKATFRDLPETRRIWFNPGNSGRAENRRQRAVLEEWAAEGKVERIAIRPGHVVYLMGDTGGLRERWAALREEQRAIIAGGAPLARAGFDLYLGEDALHYYKKPCESWGYSTIERLFPYFYRHARGSLFLRLTPLDPRELPPENRAVGAQSASRGFSQYGFVFKDYCWASIPLPEHDYPIAEISAGQYVNYGPPVWEHTIDRKADYFRAVEPAIAAEPPAARSVFDLYLKEDGLYYHKEPCAAADTAARFFLHFTPLAEQDLPPERQTYGIDNRDFDFDRHGAVFDGRCMARISRPDYPIAAVRSGQSGDAGELWTVEFHPDLTEHYREIYAAVTAEPPTYSGVFDFYLAEDGLYYHKEPCAAADTAARFFLHFTPLAEQDLPPERQTYGIDNRDFDFDRHGAVFDGRCMARISRPDYPIAAIRSGQSGDAGELWTVKFHPDLTEHYRGIYAAVTAEPPTYSGVFDLYLADKELHYVREQCNAGDTADRFLLHIIPAEVADLPEARREYGMDNRDFAFAGRGAHFDGKCMATVELPDYPIAAIRTGQFVIGEPPAWSVELAVEP